MLLKVTIILLVIIELTVAEFEAFIVGGDEVPIKNYPHSVYLMMTTKKGDSYQAVSCGASILNQKILLTAGHCLEACTTMPCSVMARFGTADHSSPPKAVSSFTVHSKYNSYTVTYDIGMACLKSNIKFGPNVKRVAILSKRPVNFKVAEVAGWGLIDDVRNIDAVRLKGIKQKIWSRADCSKHINVPETGICGGDVLSNNYAAEGDSGSALVVNGFIQVGIVSYKQTSLSKSLVIYTDVEKLYKWIQKKAVKLACIHS